MVELWALLHFIMPSLFDSHEEFSEWFSKDIENAAGSGGGSLKPEQLRRLHMILKPFMLRRVKKHVQKELGDKVSLSYEARQACAKLMSRLKSTFLSIYLNDREAFTKLSDNVFPSRTSLLKPTTLPIPEPRI